MEVKIKEPFEISVKRFYVPMDIKLPCPHCKKEVNTENFEYFSYPELNEENNLYFYCDSCEEESELPVKLHMSYSYNPKNITKI